jgi:hypothetical protein
MRSLEMHSCLGSFLRGDKACAPVQWRRTAEKPHRESVTHRPRVLFPASLHVHYSPGRAHVDRAYCASVSSNRSHAVDAYHYGAVLTVLLSCLDAKRGEMQAEHYCRRQTRQLLQGS